MCSSSETVKKIMENRRKNDLNPVLFFMNEISDKMIDKSQLFVSLNKTDVVSILNKLSNYPDDILEFFDEVAQKGNYHFRTEIVRGTSVILEERYIFSIPEEVMDEVGF